MYLEGKVFFTKILFLIQELHLKLGRQWKVTIFYTFCVKRRIHILKTKIFYETMLIYFARKTCYDYFQAYDVILKCSLFVRMLYSN